MPDRDRSPDSRQSWPESKVRSHTAGARFFGAPAEDFCPAMKDSRPMNAITSHWPPAPSDPATCLDPLAWNQTNALESGPYDRFELRRAFGGFPAESCSSPEKNPGDCFSGERARSHTIRARETWAVGFDRNPLTRGPRWKPFASEQWNCRERGERPATKLRAGRPWVSMLLAMPPGAHTKTMDRCWKRTGHHRIYLYRKPGRSSASRPREGCPPVGLARRGLELPNPVKRA